LCDGHVASLNCVVVFLKVASCNAHKETMIKFKFYLRTKIVPSANRAVAHFNHPLISLIPTYYQCSKQKNFVISCFMTIASN